MSESTLTADERALLIYLILAVTAHQKRQTPGRNRFLVLTVHFALRAGLLETAEACREVVKQDSPQHVLSKHSSVVEAAKSELFPPLVKQLQRHCSLERAEQLATGQEEELLQTDSAAFQKTVSQLISRIQTQST